MGLYLVFAAVFTCVVPETPTQCAGTCQHEGTVSGLVASNCPTWLPFERIGSGRIFATTGVRSGQVARSPPPFRSFREMKTVYALR